MVGVASIRFARFHTMTLLAAVIGKTPDPRLRYIKLQQSASIYFSLCTWVSTGNLESWKKALTIKQLCQQPRVTMASGRPVLTCTEPHFMGISGILPVDRRPEMHHVAPL
jgi:hypothetical protein